MNKSQINDIVNFVIEKELEQFKKNFNDALIAHSQDISSLSINWLCFYCKDNVSTKNKQDITSYVDEIMNKENYNVHGWMRISALQAAAYILTDDKYYLNPLLNNVACHQSAVRVFILQCVSIIAPSLNFECEHLKKAVEFNIISNYGCADESILLLLSTNGDADFKSDWIRSQLEIKKTNSTELLQKLLDKTSVIENDFYQTTFNNIKSNILFRILKVSFTLNSQMNLFENEKVQSNTLNSFIDDHPLNRSKFEFKLNQK
jgi:hypothetical protein